MWYVICTAYINKKNCRKKLPNQNLLKIFKYKLFWTVKWKVSYRIFDDFLFKAFTHKKIQNNLEPILVTR
jgi:hypothetical protein